jgi:hypothetical protein
VPDTAPDAHHLKNARQHDAFGRHTPRILALDERLELRL